MPLIFPYFFFHESSCDPLSSVILKYYQGNADYFVCTLTGAFKETLIK